ncbi:MAG: hypothetical protein IPJ40_19390 [Saprospirales bacterium]|nr:hypothetical protein [Saprospirales bacterium]
MFEGKGKILKTTDQGSIWEVIYESDVNGTGVSSIFFQTTDHGFAGTQGGNLMTTTDGGANWDVADIDPVNDQGDIIDIEFYDALNGVCATQYGGIYYTADGGASWTVGINSFIAQDIAYADATTLFAVGNGQKIYKSTDGGVNWTLNYDGPGFFEVALGVHFSDSNNGLVTSEEGAVFVTHDGGATWNNYTVANQFGLMRGAWVFNENDMYATGTPGQVYKTVDGGVNWTEDSQVNPNPSYYKILFTDNGTGFVCGSGSMGGTIFRKLPAMVLSANLDGTTDVSCNGDADGAIQVTVSGGTPPYTFAWSNGADTEDVTGLVAGEYTCMITDADGSITLGPITISEPPAIGASFMVVDESVAGANDGSIDLTVTGGTAPYIYSWSNGVNTEDLENLPDGTYCVTVTDGNFCEYTGCFTVMAGPNSIEKIDGLTGLAVSPNPVGAQDLMVDMQFSGVKDLEIRLVNTLGQEFYHLSLEGVTHVQAQIGMAAFPAGIYWLHITSTSDRQQVVKRVVKR